MGAAISIDKWLESKLRLLLPDEDPLEAMQADEQHRAYRRCVLATTATLPNGCLTCYTGHGVH